jgi:ABC-2 type transport system ATP-binding protein
MTNDIPAIHTSGLSKRFGRREALHELDLLVPQGSVFGYLGPNGAGKTTTIKLLAGLYRPSAGSARVLGRDVAAGRDAVQSLIGYLPGDFTGYPEMTGRRFLSLIGSLRGQLDWPHVTSLADRFDIDLDRRIGTLSHGNRQKVGIIHAFMSRPQLLVLDEPTSGLDPLMQREFLALVRETQASGRAVLLSSHVLSEVAAVADTVGILNEGRLLAVRTLDDLRANAARHVELRFDDHVPAEPLRRARGVGRVEVSGLTAHVTVTGPMTELIRAAAPYGVVDVVTHETDLADVFLGYYGLKGEARDPQRVHQSHVGPATDAARLG